MTKGESEKSSEWDFQKLKKYGANDEFLAKLLPGEARELVKNILYATARYKDAVSARENEKLAGILH